ncbi:MAG: hypothetical protein NC336_09115 [Clostridium sp.]|nr:hypothetical protein [Clostridium sp.]
MSIEIKKLKPTAKELKEYVRFGIDLYKGNDCFVPPLVSDDIESLDPAKNPAFEFCEAQSFMAYKDGKPAGRITAIINRTINSRTGRRQARFGWVDFTDDNAVVDALFDAAEGWARDRGITEMVGPMGFSDMDHEGMLVEGFNEMGTMATIYNYPYYPTQLERRGYKKDADWIEFRIQIPKEIPAKYQRIANIVADRFELRTLKFTSRKKIKEQYGRALFDLINESYDKLYGYSPLTPAQIEYYIDKYLGILNLECISVVVDKDDKLVGVGISMPSLSMALRRSGGRLFPFGWYHLLRALHGPNQVVDLMLIGIDPKYQGKGVNAMIFCDLIKAYNKLGFKEAESNIELEDNANVQMQWQYFPYRQHRRRRAFRRDL